MKAILGKDLKKYFMSHVKRTGSPGFYEVHTPLKVFKKLYYNRIASLLILPGEIIYAGEVGWTYNHTCYHKMRASSAWVEQIAEINSGFIREYGSAMHENFTYRTGEMVFPNQLFSHIERQCDSGIHFFLNLKHALEY